MTFEFDLPRVRAHILCLDAAQQFDAATKANMIALAVEYRQAEKNTPPVRATVLT